MTYRHRPARSAPCAIRYRIDAERRAMVADDSGDWLHVRDVLECLAHLINPYPRNANWIERNINGGWNSAVHDAARVVAGVTTRDPSPLQGNEE